MSTSQQLHASLLRAPLVHILRAAGFHSTRPSVLDTLVNITERYLVLVAESTLNHALTNHNDTTPTVTDVRMALTDVGILVPTMGAVEEDWTEKLRRPLDAFDDLKHGDIRRAGELRRRDDEDTKDVRDFIRWIVGDQNKEITRIAGMLPEAGPGGMSVPEDYLTALKKKHSKTGDESRYQGTLIGKPAEDRAIRIEGGPVESLHDWNASTRHQASAPPDPHSDAAIRSKLALEEEQAEQQLQIAMDET